MKTGSYSIHSVDSEALLAGIEITLQDEPVYCHALKMSPLQTEEILKHGYWLIMNFAVWSITDRANITTALAAVKKYSGKVQLGIRPFDEHQEITQWCAGSTELWSSPVWILLHEGTLLQKFTGLQTEKQLVAVLESML